MISEHEAQKALIKAGFTLDLMTPYRVITIVNAKSKNTRKFFDEIDYEGKYVVIGEKRSQNLQER